MNSYVQYFLIFSILAPIARAIIHSKTKDFCFNGLSIAKWLGGYDNIQYFYLRGNFLFAKVYFPDLVQDRRIEKKTGPVWKDGWVVRIKIEKRAESKVWQAVKRMKQTDKYREVGGAQ